MRASVFNYFSSGLIIFVFWHGKKKGKHFRHQHLIPHSLHLKERSRILFLAFFFLYTTITPVLLSLRTLEGGGGGEFVFY